MDKDGLKMCKIVQWLGAICLAIGVGILAAGDNEARLAGIGMALLGGWGWFTYYQIPANPAGLKGWKRVVVTPWLEDAIRRDFLAKGLKDSYSMLHAAKRFTIFCFFGCLTLGFFGRDGLITAVVVGLGAAFVYEWAVRRKELKEQQRRVK
jgi:hypothetical protein